MNFFTKKNFMFKLIVCICLFLTLLNFMGSSKVYAGDGSGVGGILINPICKLLCALGDGVMNILQKSVMGTDATLSLDNTDQSFWEKAKGWLLAGFTLVVLIGLCALAVHFGGWALLFTFFSKLAGSLAGVLVVGTCTTLVIGVDATKNILTTVGTIASDTAGSTMVLPTFNIGPDEIFSGKILLFDANIFNPKTVSVEESTDASGNENKKYYYYENGEKIYTSKNNTAQDLKNVVSKWYYIIRNIALVGSMITLLYVGIRMMISSAAEEKAKYKQMLFDWIVAICLIVFMHYIMVFAHNFTESITKVLNNLNNDGTYTGLIKNPTDNLENAIEDLEENDGEDIKYLVEVEGEKVIMWPTNMMGLYRIQTQQYTDKMEHVGYTLAYLVLVIFTLAFSLTYLKRALWLLFLTVISPFVALTYPLDKINDGKAQAFDMWLKEYIFNLLIQPFHLLLYTIFVSMAFELASTNIIYSLVVLGFMMPAEKFLRTMFGFNKASSPGMLGGATGAALTMSAMGALKRFGAGKPGGPGGPGGRGADGKGQGKEDNKSPRTNDPDKTQQSLFDDIAKENENDNGNNTSNDNALPEEERDAALDKYKAEGYGQNAYGHYFNPYTDEYDEDYDPHNDESYNQGSQEEENTQVEESEQEDMAQNEELEDSDNESSSKFMGGLKAFGKIAGQSTLRTLKSSGGKALRYTANAATAATLGGIGIAAGIAAGDINAVTKNAAIGATTGVALSNGTVNRVSNAASGFVKDGMKDKKEFQKALYGKDYEQKMREEQDEKFMKDRETRKLYKEKLKLKNKAEIDKAMADAVKYREYGVTDDKKIIKAMKMNNGNENNRADKKRIAAAKFAENTKNEKDLESHLKRFGESKGITEKQVKEMKDMVRIINNM